MKKALITGITGQDGSYLTELLLKKGYEVHGVVRRSSSMNRRRIDHLIKDEKIYDSSLFLYYADLSDDASLRRIFFKVNPDEIYHLAGQSHVALSFEIPELTTLEITNSTLKLLEICRDQKKFLKVYLAGSSEIFGNARESYQTEESALKLYKNIKVGKFPLSANGKALALGDSEGFVKTLYDGDTGEILGAHMIGPEVTELINTFSLAIRLEATEVDIMNTIFPHPTLSETIHESTLDAFNKAIHI